MYSKILKKFTEKFRHPDKFVNQLLINGNFVNSKSGKTFKTINPANEMVIAEIQEADSQDVNLAVKAARDAFDNGPWSYMSGIERGKLIFKLTDLIEQNADELAYLDSIDNGKPFKQARYVDLNLVINTMKYYAGWADKIHGQTIPVSGPYLCYTRHEPVGVCGQIIPWNFPLLMAAWKLGPALAMGCTIVLKPAEQTPLSALRLGELICEAGFPNGVVNILPGYGPTAGHALATHPLVDKIAFTGSTQVGLEIMKNSHENGLKRISLELGGKSPNIIIEDADLDFAIKQSTNAIFFNMGQCCSAGSRLFVQESIYDKFIEKAVQVAKEKKIGDPLDVSTDQGPLVDLDQKNKVLEYIKTGKDEGAKCLIGGKGTREKGFYVEPTVFSEVQDDMKIAKEEIFGPVVSILKFKSIDEVIKRANKSKYGLAAGVVTKNIENAIKLANGIRSGTIWINSYNAFDTNTPFGGFKNSGIGRELGEYGLRNYTEIKTVIIKRPDDSLP